MGGIALLIGRIVFSFFFIYSGFNHLTKLSQYAQYAGASGVPAPTLLTALSGVMLLAGGLSILLGIKPRVGALLIAAVLIPAAFTVHKFWGIADQVIGAPLAADFQGQVPLDAHIHRLGVELSIDALRQSRHHGTVDGGESHVTVAERLHVGFDAAVYGCGLHRATRCAHGDATIDGIGNDWRAHMLDLESAIHG